MSRRAKHYSSLLRRAEWRVKRIEILKRDEHTCRRCGLKPGRLHIHHIKYARIAKDPWNTPNHNLIALCRDCHGDVSRKQRLARMLRRAFRRARGRRR